MEHGVKVLALDIGTYSTGVFDGQAPYTWNFPKKDDRATRFSAFADRLWKMVYDARFDAIVYELPFFRGRDASRCLFGLTGIIEASAVAAGAAVLDVNNSTLKSWAGVPRGKEAKGSAEERNKVPMIAKAEELTGWQWVNLNEHEADAVVLYHYALERMEIS